MAQTAELWRPLVRAAVWVSALVGLVACSNPIKPPVPTLAVPTTVVAPLPPASVPAPTPAALAQPLSVPTVLLFDQAASELIAVLSQQRLALHKEASDLVLAPKGNFLAYRAGDLLNLAILETGHQYVLGASSSPFRFTHAGDALLYILNDGMRWQLRRISLPALQISVMFETMSQPPPRAFEIAPDDQSIGATVQDASGLHMWTLALRPNAAPMLIYERPQEGSYLVTWLPQKLLISEYVSPPNPLPFDHPVSSLLQIEPTTRQTDVLTTTTLWPVPAPDYEHLALFGNWSNTYSTPTTCSLRLYTVPARKFSHEVFDADLGGPTCEVGPMRWSPDGKHLLVLYTWGADRGIPGYDAVVVIDVAQGERHHMQFDNAGETETLIDVAWRDDSTVLFLTSDATADRVILSEVSLSRFQKTARAMLFEQTVAIKPFEIWPGGLVAVP